MSTNSQSNLEFLVKWFPGKILKHYITACSIGCDNLSLKHNFFAVNYRISAVETVEYSLAVFLSVYRFEKVCFPSEKAKLASEKLIVLRDTMTRAWLVLFFPFL